MESVFQWALCYSFANLDSFLRETDNILRSNFSTDSAVPGAWTRQSVLVPAAEVHESETQLSIHVDLPGHEAKDIQVKVEGDTLTIQSERKQDKELQKDGVLRSERKYGVFARSFVLPETVDASKTDAQHQNGVLTLTFPKREEAKPRSSR